MTLKFYLQSAVVHPPHVVIKKAVGLAKRKVKLLRLRQRDAKHSTYAKPVSSRLGEPYSYFDAVPVDWLWSNVRQIEALAEHYLAHRFDHLGSGWTQVRHGMQCRGLEGYHYDMGKAVEADPEGDWLEERINAANLEESRCIWRLVEREYIPIDWHLDFKSGYRWTENTWYLDIPWAHKPGVDIKVPWELARMQHLPQLAWAYALARERAKGERRFAHPEVYSQEFRNQVLDFMATNPPRFGVNWRYAMDVAIRVANWLVAYDMFRSYGAEFDLDFEGFFERSIYEHGSHIINNLEWNAELRGNHYLCDIVGLLFVSAYLPTTPETNAWLAFAVQEMVKELESQFYTDGANFEASTSYHRLVAELTIYATALVLGLPDEKKKALKHFDCSIIKVRPGLNPSRLTHYLLSVKEDLNSEYESPFPPWYIRRLEKMAEFTMHITKPDGHIPQIGDNDSGRFLKLQPVYHQITVAEAKARYVNLDGYSDLPDEAVYWDEDHLDHRHLVAEINGLFEREDFARFSGGHRLETCLVRALVGDIRFPSYRQSGEETAAEVVRIGTEENLSRLNAKLNSLPEESKNILEIPAPGGDLRESLKLYAYPDFGLYLFRSKGLYLAVRCGPIGQNGNGGHAHNDQLSIELSIDGRDLISDSGTYLYTPLPARRNEYRSVAAHFAPQLSDREPGGLDHGLFSLDDEAKAGCLYFGEKGFIGKHHGYGPPIYRIVRLLEDALHIIDYTEGNTPLKDIYRINSNRPTRKPLSPGYGWRNA